METQYLTPEEFHELKAIRADIDSISAQERLTNEIGSYTSRVLELLPEWLKPEQAFMGGMEALREHSQYVGRKVAEILGIPSGTEWIEKQLGSYYLSEVMRSGARRRIWRSADGKMVYDYDLIDHGDTLIRGADTVSGKHETLSFNRSVYPFILSLMAFAKAIDPTGERTIRTWDWQGTFFSGHNPWKGGIELLPYEKDGGFHIVGEGLLESVPTEAGPEIRFGLANGRACYPILDRETETLRFYVEDRQGTTKIGRMGMFNQHFAIKAEDLENMFVATCHLVARDWQELLYAIMEYFPDYYREIYAEHSRQRAWEKRAMPLLSP